jgi:CheY-like chemotaxis protein
MKSILVVEDNKELREAITEMLSDKFSVFSAEDGIEALQILENNHVDSILTDIQMPRMTGVELLQVLKSQSEKTPHVFVMTGGSNFSPSEILSMGASGYFEKPVDCCAIISTISKMTLDAA